MTRFGLQSILLLAVIPSLSAQEAQPKAGDSVYSTVAVALRTEARPTARVVANLGPRMAMHVNSCSKGWCRVSAGAAGGFVLAEYVSLQRPAPPARPVPYDLILAGAVALFLFVVVLLVRRYSRLSSSFRQQQERFHEYQQRFSGIIDVDAERERILKEIQSGEVTRNAAEVLRKEVETKIQGLQAELQVLEDESDIRSYAFYKPH